jgi:hypothetical protein
MEELLEGLAGGNKPWQEKTVRAGFGWDMKQKGYGVRSEFDPTGEERFHLVLPKGQTAPLSHVSREALLSLKKKARTRASKKSAKKK